MAWRPYKVAAVALTKQDGAYYMGAARKGWNVSSADKHGEDLVT